MIGNLFAPLAMKIAGGVSIALALALGLCWLGWTRAADARDKAEADLKTANAEITLLRVDAGLKETASGERQNDNAAVAQTQEELIDAIAEIPDEKPDAVRVALGCKRLRRAGTLGDDLPSVCRPESAAEAGSAP